ncbi:hypothetical protein [Corynebacterium nasicanis]|uniref:Secreted protein n=1 Tax=Corynebacterium nasicanis TaxID=1448267 RepID=A0ABW1QBE2_9CORY
MPSPSRTRALFLLGLGVVVSACSPPHEQASALKVDTATATRVTPTATTAAPLPGVIDCVGAPEHQPATLALSCLNDEDKLVDISWERWSSTTAVGTAVRETGSTRTRDVRVELSAPVTTSQGLVFSAIAVDDREVLL